MAMDPTPVLTTGSAEQDIPQHTTPVIDPTPIMATGSAEQDVSWQATPAIGVLGTEDSDNVVVPTDQEDLARGARVVKNLPNEILDGIVAQLDIPAPSDFKIFGEPTFDMTSSNVLDLKSFSLVCHKWREAALPFLFKHICLILHNPSFPNPIMRNEYLAMTEFVWKNNLKGFIKSFALCIRESSELFGQKTPSHLEWIEYKKSDFTPFWNRIFEILDPVEIKIVCTPAVLGVLTQCEIDSLNAEPQYFGGLYHFLRLCDPDASTTRAGLLPTPKGNQEPQEETHSSVLFHSRPWTSLLLNEGNQKPQEETRSSVLFYSRPWTSLLLNEGTFIPAYYGERDPHDRKPLSILASLMGDGSDVPLNPMMPSTVGNFAYIAVFPIASHIRHLTNHCPPLDKLYVQFMPQGDILRDDLYMTGMGQDTMWMERNTCYAEIMREIFSSPPRGNFRYLKEFESGDAYDVAAWEMAVEFVKRAGGPWEVQRPGVWVREDELRRRFECLGTFDDVFSD